jgi:hypothetical protein
MTRSDRTARDETGDWLLTAGARPATVAQLEARIEEALDRARASEAAAAAIGDAAIEAAEQARYAAALAERAARAAEGATQTDAGTEAHVPARARPPVLTTARGEDDAGADPDERLRAFVERANRVSARLIRLGVPAGGEAPGAALSATTG